MGSTGCPEHGFAFQNSCFYPKSNPWGPSRCLSCAFPFPCQQLRALRPQGFLGHISAVCSPARLPRVRSSPAAGGSQDTEINLLGSIITTAAAAAATANL